MHKFFFAPAVCANKKIPSQCKLRNIFSQLWIPTLPDRWPGSNWETGKAWVEGTRPTPTPPLLPLSLTNPTNPQVTNPKLLNPQIHLKLVKEESWPKNVSCQWRLRSQKRKWQTNLRLCYRNISEANYLAWTVSLNPSLFPLNNTSAPEVQHTWWQILAFKSQIDGMSISCQRWRSEPRFWKLRSSRFRGFGFRSEGDPRSGSGPFSVAANSHTIYLSDFHRWWYWCQSWRWCWRSGDLTGRKSVWMSQDDPKVKTFTNGRGTKMRDGNIPETKRAIRDPLVSKRPDFYAVSNCKKSDFW